MYKQYGERNHTGSRTNNPWDYSKYLGLYKYRECMILHVGLDNLEHTTLTQYSVNKGPHVFGK